MATKRKKKYRIFFAEDNIALQAYMREALVAVARRLKVDIEIPVFEGEESEIERQIAKGGWDIVSLDGQLLSGIKLELVGVRLLRKLATGALKHQGLTFVYSKEVPFLEEAAQTMVGDRQVVVVNKDMSDPTSWATMILENLVGLNP